ncbi:MAG: hypothetical protein ACYSX1_01905, partial [Planctomycetota bacterium]
ERITMARMTKEALIAELRARGIEFDPNAKYEDLWRLLKYEEAKVPVVSPDDRAERLSEVREPFPPELVERAKKIGMSPEMIDTYADAATLKAACDKISPQTNPDYRLQQGEAPTTVLVSAEKMPDKFEFESRLEAKFMMRNRPQFDEANLQTELRKIRRRYGNVEPVKIVKTTTFKPVKGVTEDKLAAKFLVTKFEIFMKG